ncbi:hypothetical protein CHGG_01338 [Chaetomium globosum CBS 148.51]|uniref:Zn(2)-C6 fungal-type domain-containing protein n=1 Tax=Chaetomium globosum (strain ATCC 6205 / CBS 148.51 / DSM 1962 / NBRC 6347 / NRRL 1970) TaxID=306901 RepID=Q2HEL6_CHAGB|nr:uncharacterized protein CHGG_01338 [Chaetomium globosum CBS 148.51]EAQ93103.1 hypothetical protein CHGG_01338 [Chaetomium globosum CBS 148.51]
MIQTTTRLSNSQSKPETHRTSPQPPRILRGFTVEPTPPRSMESSTMKRRAVDPAEESMSPVSRQAPYGRRQPQTSCDSCRKRKLKCDRGQPCSSCVTRGLPCHGHPSAKRLAIDQRLVDSNCQCCPSAVHIDGTGMYGIYVYELICLSPDPSSSESILRRLRALEVAVFDSHKERQAYQEQSSQLSVANTPPPSAIETDHGNQPARAIAIVPLGRLGSLKFGILPPPPNNSPMSFSGPLTEPGFVWMVPEEQTIALLQDYLDHVYPLIPIIHGPASRELIRKFYNGMACGAVTPQVAALILGMSAISAYFWQPDTERHACFASSKEASEASHTWREWAAHILANTPKEPGGCTLEEVQAWTLLSFTVQNIEGCSYHFRLLHQSSLTAARELLIHVVDSPRADPNQDGVTRGSQAEDLVVYRCNRLVGNKPLARPCMGSLIEQPRLLGFMGGPLEGIYSVQPKHMAVKYPRNMNDNDMGMFDINAPVNMSTQMSYFIQRIRIGEVVREVLDTSHPGGPDVDITDYDKVRQLDHLFEQAFMDLPPFFQSQRPLPPEKARHARAAARDPPARPTRPPRPPTPGPFLLQQGLHEPRHQRSREICLKSTRAVVSLSISTLQYSLNMDQPGAAAAPAAERPQPPTSDPLFQTRRHVRRSSPQTCTSPWKALGAESPGGRPTCCGNLVGTASAVSRAGGRAWMVAMGMEVEGTRSRCNSQQQQQQQGGQVQMGGLQQQQQQGLGGGGGGVEELHWRAMPGQIGEAPAARFGPVVDAAAAAGDVVPSMVGGDAEGVMVGGEGVLSLDGLWDGFVMGSSEDYNQLFTDLDYYCGIA